MDLSPKAKKPRVAVASGTNGNNSSNLNAAFSNALNGDGAVPHPQVIQPFAYAYPPGMVNPFTPMLSKPNGMTMAQQPNDNAFQPGRGTMPPQSSNTRILSTKKTPTQLNVKSGSKNAVAGVNQGTRNTKTNGRAAKPINVERGAASWRLQAVQAPFPSIERPHHAMVAGVAQSHSFALPDCPLPLTDRQIFSLMDNYWSLPWSMQMSNFVMYFLRNVSFFLVANPGEPTSTCPLSQNLRRAWRLFGLYDSGNPTREPYAAGICCPACLHAGACNASSFIQFLDFHNEDELFVAMKNVYQHLRSCQAAHIMAPHFTRKKYTIELTFDSMALKAFASWFCAFVHETESIEKGIHVLRPSQQRLKSVENAVVRYMNIESGADLALKDIQDTLSFVSERRGKIPGVLLASDLTKLPLDDSASEFPFCSLIVQHIEIVRVTMENPEHHLNLLKTLKKDSVVLFRCNCCHGQACEDIGPETTQQKTRSFVVYEAARKNRLFRELVKLVFYHLFQCPKMSSLNKQRLLRVMPKAEFDYFADFKLCFENIVSEWGGYVQRELEYNRMVQNVAPREDLAIWRPVNDLIKSSESIRSTYSSLCQTRVSPRLASDANDNDVIEGFDGATDYIGNRRFRQLVATVRRNFLATTDLAEKEAINTKVYRQIIQRGGRFRRLDSDGIWRVLPEAEAAKRCRTALVNGFRHLLYRRRLRRSQGKGCNVIETEIPPQFDLLSNRRRGSIVTKMTIDEDEVDRLGSKCRAVADI